jgi:hypothetical protein
MWQHFINNVSDTSPIYCDFERMDACPLSLSVPSVLKCTNSWQVTSAASVAPGILDVTIGIGTLHLSVVLQSVE